MDRWADRTRECLHSGGPAIKLYSDPIVYVGGETVPSKVITPAHLSESVWSLCRAVNRQLWHAGPVLIELT